MTEIPNKIKNEKLDDVKYLRDEETKEFFVYEISLDFPIDVLKKKKN